MPVNAYIILILLLATFAQPEANGEIVVLAAGSTTMGTVGAHIIVPLVPLAFEELCVSVPLVSS